ncbi:MAG: histidine--tRNA ligase [Candidatus Pacebacteria bacterium]|nr:histidine--tRNA ligase [Candidatus Paceibacterota bacterium]
MAKKTRIQRVTGMHDVLPDDQKYFERVCSIAKSLVEFYGFSKIDTPILEEAELYSKGTGSNTDIVQKQMYTLKTKGGDVLALRPEFTPGIARAFLDHGMYTWPQPVKLYSSGPLFRYESPQAGRYRQFNQFNLEIIGDSSAVLDAQLIQIFYNILSELKLKNLIVEINSIGDHQCRPYYKKLLTNYFRSRAASLCADCRRRVRENPLRVLDCKEEKCQRIVSQAPQTIDHLCDECHTHFKSVLEFLDEIEVPYRLNPHLVRGLDYYTKTVFEIFCEDNQKKEGEEFQPKIALAAGGRYDGLLKLLGGEGAGAVGGAIGVERIISLMKSQEVKWQENPNPQVFIAQLGNLAKRKGLRLMEEFRRAKILVAESFGKDSLKVQFKMADKLGAGYTLLLGQKEVLEGTVIIRDMKSGKQDTVKLNKVMEEVKKRLKK